MSSESCHGALSRARPARAEALDRLCVLSLDELGLVMVWALGLGLAVWGGWLGTGWLNAKLAIVLVLSGLHGVLSGRLRQRMRHGAGKQSGWERHSAAMAVIGVGAIVLLVVLKP
ncbi:CopD family protein [Paracidovorax valerianellae]|nr:hypothetical protein [Paracidovorax valerianellae]MDA8445859.1 CopD family protein [Paracidovorax valerianellae]